MLRVLLFDEPYSVKIRLEGEFTGQEVPELMRQWNRVCGSLRGRKAIFDLGDLSVIDSVGASILRSLTRSGALISNAPPNRRGDAENLNCRDSVGAVRAVQILSFLHLKNLVCSLLPASLRPCDCRAD